MEIKVYQSDLGTIRGLLLNDAPWFVGRDVALSLGYAKPENAIATHVDEEDKQIINATILTEMASQSKNPDSGYLEFDSPRGYIFINESGLYSLILNSKLPRAKEFKRWVTAEVLPSIRKNGYYFIDAPNHFLNSLLYIKSLTRELIDLTNCSRDAALSQAIIKSEELFNVDLNCIRALLPNAIQAANLINATNLGKHFGKSARDINIDLMHFGFIRKQDGQWTLTDKGKTFGQIIFTGYFNRILWQPSIIDALQHEYDNIIYI